MANGLKKVFRSSNSSTSSSSSTPTATLGSRRASFSLGHALSSVFGGTSRGLASHSRADDSSNATIDYDQTNRSFSLSARRHRTRDSAAQVTGETLSTKKSPGRTRSLSQLDRETPPLSSNNYNSRPPLSTSGIPTSSRPSGIVSELVRNHSISSTSSTSSSTSTSSTSSVSINSSPSEQITRTNDTITLKYGLKGRGRRLRSGAGSWESDSEVEDEYSDETSVDSSNELVNKTWCAIQTRLVGSGDMDLDLEKDRTSFTRSSSTKGVRPSELDEYIQPPSPLSDYCEGKHVHFHHSLSYRPSDLDPYVNLESYDDVFVRVCEFGSHDQRKAVVKTQEFLDRSMAFVLGTTTRRGQKVVMTNDEILMWHRLSRHDWSLEEITSIDQEEPVQEPSQSPSKPIAVDTNEDVNADALDHLVTVVNYCVSTGDHLFTTEQIKHLISLKLVIEEDGWI